MIPNEAIDAAGEHLPPVWTSNPVYRAELMAALEAAAPHMMAGPIADAAYQKARAEYYRYAPEVDHDPEGVERLRLEMRRLRGDLPA